METKTSNSIYVDEQENRIQLTNSTKAVVSPLSLSLSLKREFLGGDLVNTQRSSLVFNTKELTKTPATQEIANQAPE
jgi:hypothetical protein